MHAKSEGSKSLNLVDAINSRLKVLSFLMGTFNYNYNLLFKH